MYVLVLGQMSHFTDMHIWSYFAVISYIYLAIFFWIIWLKLHFNSCLHRLTNALAVCSHEANWMFFTMNACYITFLKMTLFCTDVSLPLYRYVIVSVWNSLLLFHINIMWYCSQLLNLYFMFTLQMNYTVCSHGNVKFIKIDM